MEVEIKILKNEKSAESLAALFSELRSLDAPTKLMHDYFKNEFYQATWAPGEQVKFDYDFYELEEKVYDLYGRCDQDFALSPEDSEILIKSCFTVLFAAYEIEMYRGKRLEQVYDLVMNAVRIKLEMLGCKDYDDD